MRRHLSVDRAGFGTGSAAVIVTCVHGTWARGTRWPGFQIAVTEALGRCGPVAFQYFEWSGRNSVKARARAAKELREFLLEQIPRAPHARHVLVAHSHGANIVLHALAGAGPNLQESLGGIVLLSPPLLDCEITAEPGAAANKLLLAAVAVVPLLIAAAGFARLAVELSPLAQLVGLVGVLVAWLMLFRPGAVRKRADALVRQLALPHIDFAGLVVRASRDEATVALSSVSAFARVARQVWSLVLGARTPFRRQDERRLRDARGFSELARALFDTLTLLPLSITLVSRVQAAATGSHWVTLAAVLPFAVVFATATVVIVGGSLVLLLLLPAFSFLLWPFGILPTTAAALLHVSVKRVPTPAWQVVYVESRGVARWRHSVHEQPAALQCICAYLSDVCVSL